MFSGPNVTRSEFDDLSLEERKTWLYVTNVM